MVCGLQVWVSSTSIACAIDPDPSMPLCTRVQRTSYSMSRTDLQMSFDAPIVTAVQPQNSANAARFSLTVLGVNFGAVAGEPGTCGQVVQKVLVGDTSCTTWSWTSNTALRCEVPGQQWARMFPPVEVFSNAGKRAEAPNSGLRFDGPVLTGVLPVNIPR